MPSHRSHCRKSDKEPITWGPMRFRWISQHIQPGKHYFSNTSCLFVTVFLCFSLILIFPIGIDMVRYLQRQGWLPLSRNCPACLKPMSLIKDVDATDGCVWRCNNKTRAPHKKTRFCLKRISVRNLTWFSGSHLAMLEIIELAYYWWHRYSLSQSLHVSFSLISTFV